MSEELVLKENLSPYLSNALDALEKVMTLEGVKEHIDASAALKKFVVSRNMGLESQNHVAEYNIRAERKAGKILIDLAETGERRPKGGDQKSRGATPLDKLSDFGFTKDLSKRCQAMARIPDEKFDEFMAALKEAFKEITKIAFYNLERTFHLPVDAPPLPKGKYRIIYADPPWQYGDKLIEGYGAAEHHYPSMSIKELCELPIQDLAGADSVLFFWVTSPILPECFEIIEAWGFRYKACFVWDKIKHNVGHYNSVRHEFLLICTKGSCLPDIKELHDSVVSIERTKEHSEKPEYFRELIDKMYTEGKRIELFARIKADGWDSWGTSV